jgi:peptide/nickel transport system substrate-binding protein
MKHMKWFALLMVLALVMSACAAPAAAPGAAPAGEEAAAPAAGGGEFHIAWPYDVAPKGHWNTFVTNGIFNGSPYQSLLEPPLFYYMWADASWMPIAGESWEWVDDVTLRVKLPAGAVWSDGSAYTAQGCG